MKYKALIFDMDGTIINSEHIWKKATRDLIESKGVILSDEDHDKLNERLKGLAIRASCSIIKEETAMEHALEDLMREKKQRAFDLYKNGIFFIEGFEDFHKQVLEHNLKTGIATSADDLTLQAAISHLKLDQFFGEHIYGISQVNEVYKPAPDIYLHTAAKLGIDPKECIAIEDSHYGVQAAVNAGMFCIGINTSKNRDNLKDAHLIVETYEEICLKSLLKR